MGWGGDTGGGGCAGGGVEVGGGDCTGESGGEVFALEVYGDGLPFLRRAESAARRKDDGSKRKGKRGRETHFLASKNILPSNFGITPKTRSSHRNRS